MGRVACQEGHPRHKETFAPTKDDMPNLEMAPSPWQPLNGQGELRIPRPSVRAHKSEKGGVMKVCTVNVGSLVGRSREVVGMLARRGVDVCCLQEVRYKSGGCRVFGSSNEKYKLWYSGNSDGEHGVGIMVRDDLADDVIEVERSDNRMMKIKMVLGRKLVQIFSIYAPQSGRSVQEKEQFWEKLEDQIGRVPQTEGIIIGGDVNAHVGRERNGFEEIMGRYGFGDRNEEGLRVLEVCKNHELKIFNTFFKKDCQKLITYKSGGSETQIDLILMRKIEGFRVTDCTAIPGESCISQHRLVRICMTVENLKKKKWVGRKRIKFWKLKDEALRSKYEDKFLEKVTVQSGSWKNFEASLLGAGEETCGITTGKRGRERETWWWNDWVQRKIKEKKVAFKRWQHTGDLEDKEVYKQKSREAKIQVAIAKQEAWQELAENVNSAEGKHRMFKIAKRMKSERKDIRGAKYIKDELGAIQVESEEVSERWRRYFEELLNEENENDIPEIEAVKGPIEEITEEEVKKALKGMKTNKAPGPSGLPSDMIKYAGKSAIRELTKVFRDIVTREKSPEEWHRSTTVPLFKGKGDALECGGYRGLRLLEHGMKIWEKLLSDRLKEIIKIDKCQFGFMAGRSTTDAIYIARQLQERFLEKKKTLFHVFVDLEKAFDRVPRAAIIWALRRQAVPEHLVRLVMALYEGSKSQVAVAGSTSGDFEIGVGVHQGSSLSPLLFITVMEEATKECRIGDPWELLYADDLMLTAESKKEVESMFRGWKGEMERRGLKVNIGKTKLLVTGKTGEVVQSGRYPCGVCGSGVGVNSILCTSCEKWCHKRCSGLANLNRVVDFCCPACVRRRRGAVAVDDSIVTEDGVVREVQEFCYLGDMLGWEGDAERAVRVRVASTWRKWREISSLLVNKHLPLVSRGRVYNACLRPVLLYGAETWGLTQKLENVIRSCDRRMLRFMAGVSLGDAVSSREVAESCGVKELGILLRERRLRWYGHVVRRGEGEPLRRVREVEVAGTRPRGRPKKSWWRCVAEDMAMLNVQEGEALDRER